MASLIFFPFILLAGAAAGTTDYSPSQSPLPLFSEFTPQHQPEPEFNSIIDSLISTGNFKTWANLLSQVNPKIIPFSATFFVPDDDAFLAGVNSSDSDGGPLNFLDPLLFPYHIVPYRIPFSHLRLFPAGSRIPTLLPGFSLLITSNSGANFTIDGAMVCRPDIYQNGVVSVHGVGTVLDYTRFGREIFSNSPPPRAARLPEFEAEEFDDYQEDPIQKGGAPASDIGFRVGFFVALFLGYQEMWVNGN